MKVAAAILFALFAPGLLLSQDFTRYYLDSADLQSAKQLLPGKNSTLWMGGYKNLSGENSKAWVYHLSLAGEVLEKYAFPGEQEQIWTGMDTLGNGFAAIVGLRESGGETRYYLNIGQNDSLISNTYLEALDNAILDDVRPAAGRRLLVCGFRSSPGIAGNDFFLARIQIDSAKTDWVFQDGYGPNDHISMAKELPDGSVLFCGTVADQGNNYNPCMGKLDSAGNQLWLNVVSTSWNDGAQKFTVAENGDMWLVGESSTAAGSLFDTEIFRFNPDGELLWQQWLGAPGQDAAFVIERKSLSSGYWVAGYSNAGSSGTGPISPFLMSLDSAGNSQGEVFWNMTAPSPAYSMLVDGDSVFHFCGISDNKAFLMRKKNPALQPVFVVSIPPEKNAQKRADWAEISEGFTERRIRRSRLMDFYGRALLELDSLIELEHFQPSTGGPYFLTAEFRDGCIRRFPFFGFQR